MKPAFYILLFVLSTCFAAALFGQWVRAHYMISDGKHRHQPYVVLDTEEQINPDDTLYVIAVKNDTIWLYGK